MQSVVIDASIALKCLLPEADSEAALAVVDACALQAPEWLAVECADVLARRVANGELGLDVAAAAQADLELLPIGYVADLALARPALEIALDTGLPIQDCIYLALAIDRNLQLLTADSTLLSALEVHPQLFVRVDLLSELAG